MNDRPLITGKIEFNLDELYATQEMKRMLDYRQAYLALEEIQEIFRRARKYESINDQLDAEISRANTEAKNLVRDVVEALHQAFIETLNRNGLELD